MNIERTKCLIIGSGPAGYTAAIYASRSDMNPILYQGIQPGGQLTITTDIENFPGYPEGITGPEMMEELKNQALKFNADIRSGIVTKVDFSKKPYLITIEDCKTIEAQTVIIATGASAQWLGLDSEKEYHGNGVSACATCDGFFYKNLEVAVVGGGDTACEEAIYLAKLCKKVYLIHRRNELRASKVMQMRTLKTPNIEPIWDSRIVEFYGEKDGFDKVLTGIKVENIKTGEITDMNLSGVFIAIGHKPNSEIFKGQLELDENGYIITKAGSTQTSVEGVFAAGDVQDTHFRQAITAAGTGCMAAIEADRWLLEQS